MHTDEFYQLINSTLKAEIKRHIEEYAEFYMIGDDGWDEIADNVRDIIVNHAAQKNTAT